MNFLRFLDPKDHIQLIDIGANRGEWCEQFLSCFPNTQVTAIEPARQTFQHFQARFSGDKRVRAIQAGASDQTGSARLLLSEDSTLNSFQECADKFAEDRSHVLTVAKMCPLFALMMP